MAGKIRPKALCPVSVLIVNHETCHFEIHQRARDGATRPSGADQYNRTASRTLGSELLRKRVAPTAAIEIESTRVAVCINDHGIHRADLLSFRVDRIEQRDDFLLERIGDIETRKTGSFHGLDQLGKPWRRKPLYIDQMIESVDAGRGKSIGKQGRRQRAHDVGPHEADKHSAFAHDAASTGASPPPRKSWAIRGSERILSALSSIRVCPCSNTMP